jgi:hypothetical protein
MNPPKPIGYPGSWFAKFECELLPCVHSERSTDEAYTEPYVKSGKGKWPKFLSAITEVRRVIVTRSVMKNGEPQRRAGYVGIYRIEDFSLNGSVMKFRTTDCLQKFE